MTNEIFKIEVENIILIADPCYIDGDDSLEEMTYYNLGVLIPNCTGTWTASIEMKNDIVSKLILTIDENYVHKSGPEILNGNPVDSGQMFAGDKNCFPLDYDRLLKMYEDGKGGFNNIEFLFFDGGVVCHTGHGDGTYPVLVWRGENDKPYKIVVEYLS